MQNLLMTFWGNLLQRLNHKINQRINSGSERLPTATARDEGQINFFLMALKATLNRALMDCSFDVISDSTQVEPLQNCVKDLQENVYKIGGYMLGGSDCPDQRSECWAVLIDKRCGIHHYMGGDSVCITEQSGEHIKDCYMIWNAVRRNDKNYFLCRRHTLDDNGTLTIRFFIADEQAREVNASIPEWDMFLYDFDVSGVRERKEIVIPGANHIGFGRYKSPVLSLDGSIYGKPMNYQCGKIEREIQKTLDMIRLEFKATRTKLFPDWSIVRDTDKNGNPLHAYVMDEYIYPVRAKVGEGGSKNLIDYFSPEIRSSAYFGLLTKQLEQYQALMGVQELITREQNTNGATATEIRSNNINNMAFENSVRKSISKGNEDTLQADGLYYGIRNDLWSYDESWKDIYEDEQQTLNNWLALYNAGVCTLEDVVRYWFPTLGDDQIAEKIAALNAAKSSDISGSLEEMLNI